MRVHSHPEIKLHKFYQNPYSWSKGFCTFFKNHTVLDAYFFIEKKTIKFTLVLKYRYIIYTVWNVHVNILNSLRKISIPTKKKRER